MGAVGEALAKECFHVLDEGVVVVFRHHSTSHLISHPVFMFLLMFYPDGLFVSQY